MPLSVTRDGVSVVWSDFDRALPFILEHYAEIFEDDDQSAFRAADMRQTKERYYRTAGDFFEFQHGGKTVGLLVGTPIDWSSYYIRSAAVLPDYQGRHLIQRFFPKLFLELRNVGVSRVEADTSPANMATMQLLTRMRFNVAGTQLTDRWGALVHLVKYLDDQPENVFLDQFCSGVKYQKRERLRAEEIRKEAS